MPKGKDSRQKSGDLLPKDLPKGKKVWVKVEIGLPKELEELLKKYPPGQLKLIKIT